MLNNTSHAGKETENKYVFKREQKTGRVVADVTSVGRLFHKRLPATGKARSPTVTGLVDWTTRAMDDKTHAVFFSQICYLSYSICCLILSILYIIKVASQLYFYYSNVMFTLLSTVSELYCAYCASVYFISFSHGYSAILAAKLMIKLD